jgi:hypothetical protein
MTIHESTFQYLSPSDVQKEQMQTVRDAASIYAGVLAEIIPEGPDKAYLLRKLREVGMWANIAITRDADGSPR